MSFINAIVRAIRRLFHWEPLTLVVQRHQDESKHRDDQLHQRVEMILGHISQINNQLSIHAEMLDQACQNHNKVNELIVETSEELDKFKCSISHCLSVSIEATEELIDEIESEMEPVFPVDCRAD
jgi:uncharacterized coiled-coil DUF342 family protein